VIIFAYPLLWSHSRMINIMLLFTEDAGLDSFRKFFFLEGGKA